MKLLKLFGMAGLVLILMTACAKSPDETKKSGRSDAKGVQLNAQLVKGLKQGEISGTPLSLKNGFSLEAVKKEWGEPDKHIDHEEMQDYVYERDGQRYRITDNVENEADYKYSFSVTLPTTRDAIIKEWGEPTHLETKSILQYRYNGFKIQFEHSVKNQWILYYARLTPGELDQ